MQKRISEAVSRSIRCTPIGTTPVLLVVAGDGQADASAVIRDSVLTPIDKVLWLALYDIARHRGTEAVVPSHVELAVSVNVSDTETVSRALLMLRCQRWLTACHATWCQNGWQRHGVYVLHASPLPIADTIYLDPHYLDFLRHAAGMRYARLRKAARATLKQLPPRQAASA